MQLKDEANGVLLELNSIKSERRVERMLNSDQGLQKLEEFNKMIKAEKDQKEALGAEIKKFQIEISELKIFLNLNIFLYFTKHNSGISHTLNPDTKFLKRVNVYSSPVFLITSVIFVNP